MLNKIFYHMFMWLEMFKTIKTLYQRVHINCENFICKQILWMKQNNEKSFEFMKQITVIKIILFIVLNVDL